MGRLDAMGKVQDGTEYKGDRAHRVPGGRLCLICTNVFNALGRAACVYVSGLKHRVCCQLHVHRLFARQHIWSGAYDAAHWRLILCVSTLDVLHAGRHTRMVAAKRVNALEVSSASAPLWLFAPLRALSSDSVASCGMQVLQGQALPVEGRGG